jgi:hypothetical protein
LKLRNPGDKTGKSGGVQNSPVGGKSPRQKPASGTKEYQDYTKYRLSRLIIAGAFVFIGGMLAIHYVTVYHVITTNGVNATAIGTILDRLDRSNQTLFTILLPVFGAWVGVVVAFYFGTEQARKAQETLAQALSPDTKLSTVKVEEALSEFKQLKEVSTVSLKDKIPDVTEKLKDLQNVLVLDDSGKPFGILYKADLYSQKDIAAKDIAAFTETFEAFITDRDLKDHITGGKWEKDKVIKNFATINADNSLLNARERMYGISTKDLDVLCVVVDKDEKPIGIIGFDTINHYWANNMKMSHSTSSSSSS